MPMTAANINALKTAIKTEFQRRANPNSGSLANTVGVTAFTNTPASGGIIYTDQGTKSLGALLLVKDIANAYNPTAGGIIPAGFDYNKLNTLVTTLAGEALTKTGTSCRSSCTSFRRRQACRFP